MRGKERRGWRRIIKRKLEDDEYKLEEKLGENKDDKKQDMEKRGDNNEEG